MPISSLLRVLAAALVSYCMFTPAALFAQKAADLNKAVVRVHTYDAQGAPLASTQGYLRASDGHLVTTYAAFKGARRAEITDWKGRTWPITRIAGASDAYDLVVAVVDPSDRKAVRLTTAAAPTDRGTMGLLQTSYSTDKKSRPENTAIATVEQVDSFRYYTLTTPNEARYFGCPVVNAEQQVVGIVQRNVLKSAFTACAIDAAAADSLRITAMSAFSSDLNAILIPKLLPVSSEQDAYSYLYMLLQADRDSLLSATALADFTAQYPQNTVVMGDAATFYVRHNDYARADSLLRRGEALGGAELPTLLDLRAALMYDKALRASVPDPFPAWTFDTALRAAEQAYALSPNPQYLLRQGMVLYALQRDQEALAKFSAVNASPIASPQSFLFAATALGRSGGDRTTVIALLDSALNRCPQPYGAEAVNVLWNRAKQLTAAGEYRRAVADYNDYERIVGHRNLTAYFYGLRSEIETKCRMYQQALDDLETAISLAPDASERTGYQVDKALLYLQVNMLAEAQRTAEEVLAVNPDNVDAHKVLGMVFGERKQKAKAIEHFQRAAAQGDENAQTLLKKYQGTEKK